MKKVIGVTGGVGAGKSTVLLYLKEKYGAQIIECDEIGRRLEEPGGKCHEMLLKLFSGADGRNRTAFLKENGSLDRQKIACMIFRDGKLRKSLENLVHPAVMEEVKRLLSEAEKNTAVPFSVVESAILIESGYEPLCSEIWFVRTEEAQRRRRLKDSRGYSDAKIDGILAAQKPDSFYYSHAQFIVDNSSDNVNNTFEQIDKRIAGI